jgi:hypothetical protein
MNLNAISISISIGTLLIALFTWLNGISKNSPLTSGIVIGYLALVFLFMIIPGYRLIFYFLQKIQKYLHERKFKKYSREIIESYWLFQDFLQQNQSNSLLYLLRSNNSIIAEMFLLEAILYPISSWHMSFYIKKETFTKINDIKSIADLFSSFHHAAEQCQRYISQKIDKTNPQSKRLLEEWASFRDKYNHFIANWEKLIRRICSETKSDLPRYYTLLQSL